MHHNQKLISKTSTTNVVVPCNFKTMKSYLDMTHISATLFHKNSYIILVHLV